MWPQIKMSLTVCSSVGCMLRSVSAWRKSGLVSWWRGHAGWRQSLTVLPFHSSRYPLSRINPAKRPECKWWKSFLTVPPLSVDAGISGISWSLNMEAAGLKLQLFSAQASCLLPHTPSPPPTPPSGFVRVSAHHWQLKALGTVPLVVPEKCQSFWRQRVPHRRRMKAQMALMDEQNPTEGPGQSHTRAPSK